MPNGVVQYCQKSFHSLATIVEANTLAGLVLIPLKGASKVIKRVIANELGYFFTFFPWQVPTSF